jgi:hypothetical protein
MRARMIQLAARVSTKLDTVAAGVRDKVEGCEAAVDCTSTTTVHRFRSQIVEIAKQRGYWADLREPWEWVRLQLRDGGTTDVVVAVHFIGNPSPGACAAVAFMKHRAIDEDELRSERIPIDTETLVLYPAKEPASQRARLAAWLGEIVQSVRPDDRTSVESGPVPDGLDGARTLLNAQDTVC